MKGDILFLGEEEVEVQEADPKKNGIKVRFTSDSSKTVLPQDILMQKPVKPPSKKKRSQKSPCPAVLDINQISDALPSAHPTATNQEPPPAASSDLEFTTFILTSGLVIRVGFVYFIESSDSPFVVSRIFQSNGSLFVSYFRCKLSLDKSKVICFLKDFKCTLN